ncbi:Protein O-mannosyl-transferase TMTC4 [Acropora cervicornis]|uniref:dolichyl-phosphate-mannose--protein mannosyltransferase n=1 Tax=Acropora cervicornis TaxID=6130 RepID=A0AAD9VGK7_ACRCE|nr:Protein O-mannosyl-transferase TMTC4 [Acropora cervicornis]
MASRYRANGSKLRKRTANDQIGEEREITDLDLNAANAGCKHIGSDFPVPNLSFNVASFIVCCVSIICYWDSCKGGFVFDDSEAIVSNKDLRDEIPLGKLFVHDFWGENLSSNASHKSYRPLTILTFRFNYWLAGGLNPWGFHLFNVILNAVVSILSLKFFLVLISNTNNDKNKFSTPKASLFCALLFAVHPIHTESVAGLVGRADLLGALFFILSFLFYERCCAVDHEDNDSSENFSWKYLLLSMAFCCIAMLCKEQGITVLGICSVYDVIVVCRIDPVLLIQTKLTSEKEHRNGSFKMEKGKSPLWMKGLIYRHAVLLITGLILLLCRWHIMGSSTPVFQVLDNPASFEKSFIMRVINYNYLYAVNAWLLIVPQWLCFDWSMGCVPLIKSFTDPRLLCIAALWAVLLLLILYCLFGKDLYYKRILIMGLALLVVPFLPASNLFFTVGFVVAERVLYLSSLGSCLIVVLGFVVLSRKGPTGQKLTGGLMWFLIVVYAARTIQRSSDWIDEDSLFTSGLSVCPLNAKVHYNVGKVRTEKRELQMGEKFYREAIRYDDGRYEEAEVLLERAVKIRRQKCATEKLYCIAQFIQMLILTLEIWQQRSSHICYQGSQETHSQGAIRVLYHRWGKYDKAGIHYKRALMLEPRNENVLQNVQKLKRAMQRLSNGGSKKKIRK